MSGFIGPALPPHLKGSVEDKEDSGRKAEDRKAPVKRNKSSSTSSRADTEDESGSVLILTADMSDELFGDEDDDDSYGPALPPGFKKTRKESEDSSNSDSEVRSGRLKSTVHSVPSSPPAVSEVAAQSEKDGDYLGPALPPGFKLGQADGIGPVLPPGFELPAPASPEPALPGSDSEGEAVGPHLEFDINSQAQRQLELRARRLKHDMISKDSNSNTDQKRESWMLELPPEKAVDLGLGPRQFRTRAREDPGDRSVWTDTPADKLKKKTDPKAPEPDSTQLSLQAVQERDEAMDKLAEKHGSKRGSQSLLEMHQDKLKKKKKKDKKEGKTEERRPFSRELDLQTNRFDEAQKKSIFNKARLLNDRFSAGQSKYL